MSDYHDAINQEAFGHVPLFQDRGRDEDRLPLGAVPQNRVYFHMQERKYKVDFNGVTQPESFDSWDGADAFFDTLRRKA